MLGNGKQAPVFVVVKVDVEAAGVTDHRRLGPVVDHIHGHRNRSLLHRRERERDHLQEPGWAGNGLHPDLHADRDRVPDAAPVAGLDRGVFCQAPDG